MSYHILKIFRKWSFFFFVTFILSLILRFIYIDEPIVDIHTFRQTQTAISVEYMLQDGLSWDSIINYKTPVFGPPWTIPMEFPFYQVSAYYIHKIMNVFGMDNLDFSLRITSLVYFYLSLFLLYRFLSYLSLSAKTVNICCFLYMILPFSIFWSRTAMIESCALFWCLGYLFCLIKFLNEKRLTYLFVGIIAGVIGFLTKITTAFPFCVFAGIYILHYFYQNKNEDISSYFKSNFYRITGLLLLIFIPFSVFYVWLKYSDTQKDLPLIDFLTSKNLKSWNFGVSEDRVDIFVYREIAKNLWEQWPSSCFALFFIIVLFKEFRSSFSKIEIILLFSCSVSFALTLLTFTNLYYIHNYYYCAVFIFECIIVAIIFTHIDWKNIYTCWKGKLLLLAVLVSIFYTPVTLKNSLYVNFYLNNKYANWHNSVDHQIAQTINDNTSPEESVIIFSHGWEPVIPYYSHRKALMVLNLYDISKYYQKISEDKEVYGFLVISNNDDEYASNMNFFKKNYEIIFIKKVNEFELYKLNKI